MDKDSVVWEADKLLDELTKSLSPKNIKWMKENFEKHIPKLLSGAAQKLEINLVVDTNSIIRALLQYAKGKTSLLFKLLENPIFRLYAPKQAEQEVISSLHRKKKVNIDKALEGWSKLKNVLKFDDAKSKQAILGAQELIGKRDPKDVAFVALYLQIGAVGIVTDDKDYDHPLISKTNIENVGEMVARFHRGVLSFVVLHDLAPVTLKVLFDLLVIAVKSLFDILKFLYELVTSIAGHTVAKLIELIGNLPSWIRDLILGILLGAGIALLLNEKLRTNIIQAILSVWDQVKPKLIALLDWIKDNADLIIEKIIMLAPYVEVTTIILLKLGQNIAQVVEETKLNSARISLSAT